MIPYQLLQDFLPLLNDYTQSRASEIHSVEDFTTWLNLKNKAEEFEDTVTAQGDNPEANDFLYVTNVEYIVKMYRYAKNYARAIIPQDSLISFEDYSYLVILFYKGKHTKSQLITENIQEKSTGMEIIKRLIRLGLVSQEDHEIDKRSKWVDLTPKGRAEFMAIQDNMYKLTRMINADLKNDELQMLYKLLNKLNDFHASQFLGA